MLLKKLKLQQQNIFDYKPDDKICGKKFSTSDFSIHLTLKKSRTDREMHFPVLVLLHHAYHMSPSFLYQIESTAVKHTMLFDCAYQCSA